jgi:hypothetical protein
MDPRPYVRLEAENFLELDRYELVDSDRQASHQLHIRLTGGAHGGRISVPWDEPYTAAEDRYEFEVRYLPGTSGVCRYSVLINGARQGESWQSGHGTGWQTHVVPGVAVRSRDVITVETSCENGAAGQLDYVQLTREP